MVGQASACQSELSSDNLERPTYARIPRVGVKVLVIPQHPELLVVVIKLPSRVPPYLGSYPHRHASQRRLVRQWERLHTRKERSRRVPHTRWLACRCG